MWHLESKIGVSNLSMRSKVHCIFLYYQASHFVSSQLAVCCALLGIIIISKIRQRKFLCLVEVFGTTFPYFLPAVWQYDVS